MARFDAVIFDMDGTLVLQRLDFAAIRAELGIARTDGIIEAIEAMEGPRRDEAHRHVEARELDAARHATLAPGAAAVVAAVRAAGLKTALLTRNSEQAMRVVLETFDELAFDLTWSRLHGPIKPEPDGVLAACEELGATPQRTASVGDFRYDITAANAAGCVSVLVTCDRDVDFAHEADYVIGDLMDLPDILGIEA